jgi:hypothetical protein
MVDYSMSIVLLGGNRNRIASAGRGWCSCSRQISMSARIEASVGKMSLLSTVEASMISKQQILSSLGPLHILTPSSWGVEIVGALNHMTLWGRKSMSSRLRSLLRLQLKRTEHMSS